MSVFDEKIIDKLWSSVEPVITLSRILEVLLLTIIVSPHSQPFLDIHSYELSLKEFLNLLQQTISATQIHQFAFVLFWVFIAAPLITSALIKLFINRWLIKLSNPLVDRLVELKKEAQSPGGISKKKIHELLTNRTQGLDFLERIKSGAEAITVFLPLFFLFFDHFEYGWMFYIGSTLAWVLIELYLAQKILIIHLEKIQPFNIVNTELYFP